jgi:hypothetical protein
MIGFEFLVHCFLKWGLKEARDGRGRWRRRGRGGEDLTLE